LRDGHMSEPYRESMRRAWVAAWAMAERRQSGIIVM
jgi:hypothetical protein